MPLLDTAIAHSSFQSYLGYSRLQLFLNGKVPNYSLFQHEERWSSFQKSFPNTGHVNFYLAHFKKWHPKFLVKAVATCEPKCFIQTKVGENESNTLSSTAESVTSALHVESSTEGSEELDEREKLRRMRISKANRGNTPWNKGRKHSPETLRRIRERTRLAMQSPKVKMKLMNMGHAQSPETRVKIAVGVRMGWQKRRKKLMLQETCLFDWQNLIAEAARKGFCDEEELQWDSYKILNERLQQEWLDSIEYRKTVPRNKSSKRAPKSPEQRRKIAEAIAAKWADPDYRSRVCSALAKYHGIPEGAERKVRKKASGEGQSTKTSKKKSDAERSAADEMKVKVPKLKKRNAPKYKDPLVNSKLEMLKSIRAQRVASETTKNEALERARLLIAEAQKAAKALEAAALRSPVAQASLIEAKKLIAEATQSIESIDNAEFTSQGDVASEHQNYVKKDGETITEDTEQRYHKETKGIEDTLTEYGDKRYQKEVNGIGDTFTVDADQEHNKGVNGVESLQQSEGENLDIDLFSLTMLDDMDKNYQLPANLSGYEFSKLDLENSIRNLDLKELMDQQHPEPNGSIRLNGFSSPNGVKLQSHEEHSPPAAKTVVKKWVRGRLVEVVEGE